MELEKKGNKVLEMEVESSESENLVDEDEGSGLESVHKSSEDVDSESSVKDEVEPQKKKMELMTPKDRDVIADLKGSVHSASQKLKVDMKKKRKQQRSDPQTQITTYLKQMSPSSSSISSSSANKGQPGEFKKCQICEHFKAARMCDCGLSGCWKDVCWPCYYGHAQERRERVAKLLHPNMYK